MRVGLQLGFVVLLWNLDRSAPKAARLTSASIRIRGGFEGSEEDFGNKMARVGVFKSVVHPFLALETG